MATTAKANEAVMDYRNITAATKALLEAEPKVRVKIPLLSGSEKSDETIYISINGYDMRFNRGKSIEVPESVAELLEKGGVI